MNKTVWKVVECIFAFFSLLTLIIGIQGIILWTTLPIFSRIFTIGDIFCGLFGLLISLYLIRKEPGKGGKK